MKRNLLRTLAAIVVTILFAAWGEAAEQAATIDISGHPFKGPANAPVTVVVFSDYF